VAAKEGVMSDSSNDSPQPAKKDQGPVQGNKPAWIGGVVLVAAGVFLLLGKFTRFSTDNWWAVFLLIPAAGSLWTAYTIWRRNEWRFNAASRGPLIGGLVLVFLAVIFLFELDFGRVWPGFLIIVGGGLLLTGIGER
jgi:drug/metabolite transporter (DMT)-like permease